MLWVLLESLQHIILSNNNQPQVAPISYMLVSYLGLLLYGDDSVMGLPIAVDNLQSKNPFITVLIPIGLSFTDIELFR